MIKKIYMLGFAVLSLCFQAGTVAAQSLEPQLADFAPAQVRSFDLPLWRGAVGPEALAFANAGPATSPWLPQYLIIGAGPEFQDQSVIDFQLFKAEFTGDLMLDPHGFFGKSTLDGGIVMYTAARADQIIIMEEMHKFAYTRAFEQPLLDQYNAISTAFVHHELTIYYVLQFASVQNVDQLNQFAAAARTNLDQLAVLLE